MIAYSGIDCSGKSTQIENVCRILRSRGHNPYVFWSRVGYTPGVAFIRRAKSIMKNKIKTTESEQESYLPPDYNNSKKRTLLLWFSVFDLVIFYGIWFRIIEAMGNIILADRYIWDSYIDLKLKYSVIGFEKWLVWRLLIIAYLKPEHSFIYTIPVAESVRRSDAKCDPFPEGIEQRQVRLELYMEEKKKGKWKSVIDAQSTAEKVLERTMKVIDKID